MSATQELENPLLCEIIVMVPLPEDQIEELRQFQSDLHYIEEAGHPYILFKKLILPEGCEPKECDALLCPDSHLGYEARLLFSTKINSRNQLNWHYSVSLFGKNWYAFSWQLNNRDLRLIQILSMFLGALS